jgi:hypothetical protein
VSVHVVFAASTPGRKCWRCSKRMMGACLVS